MKEFPKGVWVQEHKTGKMILQCEQKDTETRRGSVHHKGDSEDKTSEELELSKLTHTHNKVTKEMKVGIGIIIKEQEDIGK